jgi:hypothetical protein
VRAALEESRVDVAGMSEHSAPVIEGSVLPHGKAEEVAAIFKAMHDDIGLMRAEMAAIRGATTGIQDELTLLASKADASNLRSDVQTLNGRIRQLEGRLLVALGAIAGLLAGLLIAALRYWASGHA